MRLLVERIRLCPTASLPEAVARTARVAHLVQNQTLIQQLIDISCTAMLCPAIAARRDDLRGTENGRMVATHLRSLRDRLWRARIDTLRGEGTVMFQTYADIDQIPPLTTSSSASGPWERMLETMRAPLALLVYRLNREPALRHVIDVEIATDAASYPSDLLRRSTALSPPKVRLEWLASLAQVNPFPINGAYTMINANLVKTLLSLDVVACDLAGDPMPPDPFSPTLAPLRPVERDGRLIGWYSVGLNGVDDGGQQSKDHGIPLAESFGKTFADPPKPR